MDRHPVGGTSIISVGYDDATTTLEVEFKQGRIYQYFDVPRGHYEALLREASPGAYLAAHVKPYYRCTPT